MNIDWIAYEEDDVAQIYCEACGKYTSVRWVDEGVGGYEYWGSKGTHHDWILVTDCCRDEVSKDEIKKGTR